MNAYIAFTIAAACIVVIAAIGCYYLGRRSLAETVNTLNLRNAFHEKAIGEHIDYEDDLEKALAEVRAEFDRERENSTYLRRRLAVRSLGTVPLYDQVARVVPEPPPIPADYLVWTGSAEGETGAWSRDALKAAAEEGEAHRAARLQAEQDIEPCHLCSDVCDNAEEFLGRYPHLGRGVQGERNPCQLCGTDQDSLDEVYAFFAAMALEPEYAEIVDEVSTS